MNKEQIIENLEGWNFWRKDITTGIYREKYHQRLERYLRSEQIVVITGIRRSGKSTLMKQFIKKQIEKGVERKNFLYVNFEEPNFTGLLSLDFLQQIYNAYREIIKPSGKYFILLDEVQKLHGWERFARSLHEKKEAQIIVSGSNANLLSKEFGILLTGRWLEIKTYPLDFNEYLIFKNISLKNRSNLLLEKTKIKQHLREYLEYGGFPLVVLQEEKKELLNRYFDDVVSKDISERYNIRNTEQLRTLGKYYLTNISCLFSYRTIMQFVGVSLDTIERYSQYFNNSYLFFYLPKFSYSLKKQQVNQRKVYAIDSGLINMISFRFSENIGRLYENTVYLSLQQMKQELYYYKTDTYEVDFVIKRGTRIKQILQVCYDIENLITKNREIHALLKASKELKCNNLLIITEDKEGEELKQKKKIKYIPLWKWLLETN